MHALYRMCYHLLTIFSIPYTRKKPARQQDDDEETEDEDDDGGSSSDDMPEESFLSSGMVSQHYFLCDNFQTMLNSILILFFDVSINEPNQKYLT